MQKLHDAYEARSKKQNKIETIKALKNPMQAYEQLETYAKNGYDSILDEDKKYFLKCFGIFDKDGLTPKQFMMRIRIPGGHLTALQAKKLGEIAKDFAEDYIDITTRSQIELRYLHIEDIPKVIAGMNEVGIDSYQTGVDNFRNIVTDPLNVDGFDNILPAFSLMQKIQSQFLHNPEWISTLPRKFNTGLTGSLANRCNVFGQDCCFVLAQKDGVYGYNMYLGGRVGMIAKNANIFLKNDEEVLKAFESITSIFKRYGFRDNRNKNRLHFLIEAVGMQSISEAIREVAGIDFATAGHTMTNMNANDSESGRVALRDGSFGLQVVVPSGIFSGSDLIAVAELSKKYGNSQVRFNVEQNIFILGVRDVDSALSDNFFKKYKNVNTPYFNNLIACAGTKHCAFGVIENKEDAIELSQYLSEKVPMDSGRIRMYWSACVKGCGTHEIADIGFEGCKAKVNGVTEDGVHVTLGGKLISDGQNGYTVLKAAPLRYTKYYIESIALEYQKLRLQNESFESFNDRVLLNYSPAYIGFYMQLSAYLRAKNIEINLNIDSIQKTCKTEEYEIFELGRRLYYQLTKHEPYSGYSRFTNLLSNELPTPLEELYSDIDLNVATMVMKMIDHEQKRASVFSELTALISL